MRRLVVALVGVAWLLAAQPASAARRSLPVILPDPDNLQYLTFWVALGAGYFADEGFDVQVMNPERPNQVGELWAQGKADVAVLPPPSYVDLIAQRVPIRIVANLLQNDPINLIVKRDTLTARALSPSAPLADRLRGLHGLRIGVAHGPVSRLRALFGSVGLDVDREMTVVIIEGRNQNAALANGEVDALFAHSPYLEKALADQGAAILVNLSAGEAPVLASREVHALVVSASFAETYRDETVRLVRAIARAETLIHTDHAAAAAAIVTALPKMERRLVDVLMPIYDPAVPATSQVSAEWLWPPALFPAGRPMPSLDGIDLASVFDASFATEALRPRATGARWRLLVGLGLAVVAAGLVAGVVVIGRRGRRSPT